MVIINIEDKVKELWNIFLSAGFGNPIDIIQQINYLLFMKHLDDEDQKRISDSSKLGSSYDSIFAGKFYLVGEDIADGIPKEALRWTNFAGKPSDEMFQLVQIRVFPFIKSLNEKDSPFAKYMDMAVFLIPRANLLTDAVKLINEIWTMINDKSILKDTKGHIYEYILQEYSKLGNNKQFRTPVNIINMLVELVNPKLGDKIADPVCGTAGFLLGAFKYICMQLFPENKRFEDNDGFFRIGLNDLMIDDIAKDNLIESTFYGYDNDLNMIRISLMNLIMNGIQHPNIMYTDTLSKHYNEENEYDIVFANPPFTGRLDKNEINDTLTINTKKTELLFLERIYKMLRIGGTAGVIVPQGVLFGSQKAVKEIRSILVEKCDLKAVISMPSGIFRPYAGVSTAILIFTKGGQTDKVWFYNMKHDGKTLDDKRTYCIDNDGERDYGDLHNIIKHFNNREVENPVDRQKQYFFVSKNELVEKGYDMAFNRYWEEVYNAPIYRDTDKILTEIKDRELSIIAYIEELQEMLKI